MRVTVVMAVHNGLPYLEDAVSSVLRQTLDDFMLVVVDDASTDGSVRYLQTVPDRRVRVIAQETRRGAGPARNVGIMSAESEFVAFMDADDVSLPSRLERQVDFLDHNPTIGAVGTSVSYCTRAGRSGFVPPIARCHDAIRADLLAGRHAMVNATLMIRTHVLKGVGGFRIAGYGEDWDLLLRLTEACRVANLSEVLYLYRPNPRSSTLLHSRLFQARIAHACECARRRAGNRMEIPFEQFCAQYEQRPTWIRWREALDDVAVTSYHKGIAEILEGNRIGGYTRCLLASAIAPQRVAQRLRRTRLYGRTRQ